MKPALPKTRLFFGILPLLVMGVFFDALIEECYAANVALSREELSRAWNEQFSQPIALPNATTATPTPPALMPDVHRQSDQPHPAVARIIVPEGEATSYGSGTLVDARDQFGLVITNWHVVRDAKGDIEVLFPNGFQSKARALKVDADWDLAALVIWQPQIEPVSIAQVAPQPGDQLTICGYGQGMYRAATGRCTQYYAPRLDFPRHMVELDVEARQGDSGGPIFNTRGELAGVLFGAGQGTTLGSFGGRVKCFLATLAPDIGQTTDVALVRNKVPPASSINARVSDPFLQTESNKAVKIEPRTAGALFTERTQPLTNSQSSEGIARQANTDDSHWRSAKKQADSGWPQGDSASPPHISRQQIQQQADANGANWRSVPRTNTFEQIKTGLAVIGVMALAALVLRVAR